MTAKTDTVESLRAARDEAVRELAEVKAELSAHRLHCTLPDPTFADARSAHGGAPLRYQMVDAVNDGVKRVLPRLHSWLRGTRR